MAEAIVIKAVDSLLGGRWQPLRLLAVIALLGLSVFTYGRGIKVLNQYKAYNEQVEREIATAPGQAILRERQFDIYSRFRIACHCPTGTYSPRTDGGVDIDRFVGG